MNLLDTGAFERLHSIYVHRYEPEYTRVFANLYWRGLLVLACVVVVGAGIYGAIVFFGALPSSSAGAPVTASGISTVSNLDRPRLDATLNGFAARQQTFKNLLTGAIPPLSDPSK